jgi:hypothetical protein
MAKQNFWQRLAGGAANAVLPGSPYDRYSGFNPTLTRNSIISGVIGQVVPGGGTIANTILNRGSSAQAANAGQEGLAGLMRATNTSNRDQLRQLQNPNSSIQPDFVSAQPGQFDPAVLPDQQGGQGLAGLALSGMPAGSWNPSSNWGRDVLAGQNNNPGSVQNFGNNVDGFRGGGGSDSVGDRGYEGGFGGGGFADIVGGRFAGGSAVDHKKRSITFSK